MLVESQEGKRFQHLFHHTLIGIKRARTIQLVKDHPLCRKIIKRLLTKAFKLKILIAEDDKISAMPYYPPLVKDYSVIYFQAKTRF